MLTAVASHKAGWILIAAEAGALSAACNKGEALARNQSNVFTSETPMLIEQMTKPLLERVQIT